MSVVNNTANKNFAVKRTKQKRLMLVSNCTVCGKNTRGSFKIKMQVDQNSIKKLF